jgi:glutaminyl-peptide cyclotransferase
MTKRATVVYLIGINLMLLLMAGWYTAAFRYGESTPTAFNGQRALGDVATQLSFGPRPSGSEGHAKVRSWIQDELESTGWIVEIPEVEYLGHPIFNIIAKRNTASPQIILGAHYDTRFIADKDPDPAKRTQPVAGANDGASGVAILLELARTLPEDTVPTWLVFFDAEDNGRIGGWDGILGSRAFVAALQYQPRAVVIADMVGDADLDIYLEGNSDAPLRDEIWQTAADLGHESVFINQEKYSILDDHLPFLEAGIPAVDLIDFDYPYWHTTQDTLDKVSAQSLQAVGETLWTWVVQQDHQP